MSVEYTNIYLQPFLNIGHRQKFDTFINNTSIFLPELMYESGDPKFGVQTNLRMYLEYGIERRYLDEYASVLDRNFYFKKLLFGNIKSLTARDSSNNKIYDVVYVDIVDTSYGNDSYIFYRVLEWYPCTINNMKQRFRDLNFQINDELMPRFMHKPEPVFMPVAVLCYTLPEKSNLILSKIKHSKFSFSDLDFVADRFIVEQSLDNEDAKYLVFPKRTISAALDRV